MSEQAAEAADQVGHVHGAEAENAADEHEGKIHAAISKAFHDFATRLRGEDPAAVNAEQQAQQGGGLVVEKTEGEANPTAGPDAPSTDEQGPSDAAGSPAGSSPGPSEHPGIP